MDSALRYNETELIAVTSSRILEDGKVVFVGAGLPLISASLAQKMHAPRLTIIFEGGVIAPELLLGKLPASTNEARAARRAFMLPTCTDTFLFQQRGFVDYAFIGGAQIDAYGNINTTVIGDYFDPKVRLPGSGGANDLSSSATRTIIVTRHERRRFAEKVDFVTSPGYLAGANSRKSSGLLFGCVYKLVSNLCIMGFDEVTKRMKLEALHQGATIEKVMENTGFKFMIPQKIDVTEPPTGEELMTVRELDPQRRYLGPL